MIKNQMAQAVFALNCWSESRRDVPSACKARPYFFRTSAILSLFCIKFWALVTASTAASSAWFEPNRWGTSSYRLLAVVVAASLPVPIPNVAMNSLPILMVLLVKLGEIVTWGLCTSCALFGGCLVFGGCSAEKTNLNLCSPAPTHSIFSLLQRVHAGFSWSHPLWYCKLFSSHECAFTALLLLRPARLAATTCWPCRHGNA